MTLAHLKSVLDRAVKEGEEIRYLLIDETVPSEKKFSLEVK